MQKNIPPPPQKYSEMEYCRDEDLSMGGELTAGAWLIEHPPFSKDNSTLFVLDILHISET